MKRRVLAILLLLCLTGCSSLFSIDSAISLSGHGKWSSEIFLNLPAISEQMVDSNQLRELNQQLRALGVQTRITGPVKNRRGYAVYSIRIKGEGYDQLNQVFGLFYDRPAFTRDPEHLGRIHFSFNPGSVNLIFSTFTLHSGKIISTNGVKVNPWTVRWETMDGPMEAVVEEGNGLLVVILWVCGGLLGLGVLLILLTRRQMAFAKPVRNARGGPVRNDRRNCPICHHSIPRVSKFCPYCGRRQRH